MHFLFSFHTDLSEILVDPTSFCVDIKNLLCILCDYRMQFLSMKLAAVNPRLDLSIDDLFEKEVRNIMWLQFF